MRKNWLVKLERQTIDQKKIIRKADITMVDDGRKTTKNEKLLRAVLDLEDRHRVGRDELFSVVSSRRDSKTLRLSTSWIVFWCFKARWQQITDERLWNDTCLFFFNKNYSMILTKIAEIISSITENNRTRKKKRKFEQKKKKFEWILKINKNKRDKKILKKKRVFFSRSFAWAVR